MDVSTAILYGDAEEDVYVIQPHDLEDGIGRICKFQKALYGLHRPHRIWPRKSGYCLSPQIGMFNPELTGTLMFSFIALTFWDPHRGIYSQIGLSDGWIGPSYLLPGNDHNSNFAVKNYFNSTNLPIYLSRSRVEGEWDVQMQTCGCTHGQSSVSSRDGLWSNRSCLGYKAIPQAVLDHNWTLGPTRVYICI